MVSDLIVWVLQVDAQTPHARQHVLHGGEQVVQHGGTEGAPLCPAEPTAVDYLHLLHQGALSALPRACNDTPRMRW